MKNLGNNMIVSGRIMSIQKENRKKTSIEVRLERVAAICYDGPNLIKENESNCLNEFFKFYENLYGYNIIGVIRKNEVKIKF
jgi:hypothetical protein